MKKNVIIRILSLLVFFSFITIEIFGQQTGKIAGRITDKKTGETLIGLSVKVNNTTIGVSTDINGHYVLSNLIPGKYNVTFSYLGYQSKSITDIDVATDKTTNLDLIMNEAASKALAEVVVTASAKKESLNALYAQQKNSSKISDGISAESIRRSPDKNTAEVLKRVSGVTIQDNKFVIVRGLSDRYNTASLDNGALPSTEPNRKAFSFDIVPSNMIDNIIISKTATPDMPGDFAGGSVQILTKDIPDQNFASYGLGYGYNSQSTFKDFKGSHKGFSDYKGFNNSYNLPSNFPSSTAIGNLTSTTPANLSAINSISRDLTVYRSQALLGQNYQATVGRVKKIDKTGNKLGAIFSLSYKNSQITNPEVIRELVGIKPVDESSGQFRYSDETYKFSTNLGALANFAYVFKNNKITLKNIYNRTQDDQYLYRTGTNLISSSDIKYYAFDLMQKSLLKSTLDGEHKFGESKTKLKWTAGYSNVINTQPNQFKVGYQRNIADRNDPFKGFSASVTNGIGKENTRLFSDLAENIYSGEVSLSLPFTIAKNTGSFKIGGSSSYRNRSFNVRYVGLILENNAPDFEAIRLRPLATLFGSDLINQGVYKLSELPNGADRYDASALTNSGYVMMDNKFGEKIRLVWGLRAEQYNLHLQTFNSSLPKVHRNQLDLLPSLNWTYSITEKSNFRASYYSTLARPEFRELAPFSYYDYEQNAMQKGESSLKRTQINNADLRYEIYPSAGQVISASVFYKHFKNAIEATMEPFSTPTFTYLNADIANTYGVEFEFRKTLDFINNAPAFKNTTLYTNISFIKSRVQSSSSKDSIDRPMVGQSPYVINAGLQHSALNNKLSFNLLYNRIGRRIFRVASTGNIYPHIWEAPKDMLDFQVGLKVLKSKAEIKINAGDILNQASVFYFDRDENKKFTPATDDTHLYTHLGRNLSMAFNYSF